MMGNMVVDMRRLAAWAVAAALLLMLLSFLLGPVVARHRAYDAEIARDRQVLERLSRLEASRERIDEAAKRYRDEDFASLVYAQAMPSAQIALDVQKHSLGYIADPTRQAADARGAGHERAEADALHPPSHAQQGSGRFRHQAYLRCLMAHHAGS